MYNNPYLNAYNPQISIDKLNEQINQLESMKKQIQQPAQPSINQTFQLAPTSRDVIRYAASLEEVQRDMVIGDTPYFSKDMSVVWIKNIKGEIKTYELTEIIPKDSKDLQIELLQTQINELRKEMKNNERIYTNANAEQTTTNTTEHNDTDGTAIEKTKPASIQKVSGSKKE